jgi:hypothetical protein
MGTGALLNNNASYYGRYQTHENKSSTNESSGSASNGSQGDFVVQKTKGVRSSVRSKNPKIYQSAVEMHQSSNNLAGGGSDGAGGV